MLLKFKFNKTFSFRMKFFKWKPTFKDLEEKLPSIVVGGLIDIIPGIFMSPAQVKYCTKDDDEYDDANRD